ncbi:hypothetical protein [Parageobacillus thermoglucosidasius]|nr:hypothetical protein [Parageobacillus thermoglucosidasius]
MARKLRIDANVIVPILTGDPKELAKEAREMLLSTAIACPARVTTGYKK